MALQRKPQEIVESSKNPLLSKHESWERVSVGEIADILNGFAFKSDKFTHDKGTPLIRIRDVGKDSTKTFFDGDFDEAYIVDDGDLLVGMDGDFRCSIWKGGKALLNQRVCKISLKTDSYDFGFLSYALQPYLDAIHAETSAVTVKHLSSRSISEIPLPLPPLKQQKRIVAKIEELFSHIDAGIEALKKAKQLLKQYRQSVLKAAVTGELTKEWREANKNKLEPASQLLERILKERRQKWEEQQLEQFKAKGKIPKDDKWKAKYINPLSYEGDGYEIPESWIMVRAEQICEFITKGTTPKRDKLSDGKGEIPFIKVYNITFDTSLNFKKDPTFTDKETHEGFLARSKVFPGDVLMNIVGPPLGKVSIVPTTHDEWNINQAIAVYRPIVGFDNKVLASFLLSKPVVTWMLSKTKTTAGQVNLTLEISRNAPIPIMPIEEQKEIARLVEEKLISSDRLLEELDTQHIKAEKNKQSILASAFSGTIN